MLKHKVNKFIKYPLDVSSDSWLEELMIRFGAGIIKCNVCGSCGLIHIKGTNLRETCFCAKCKSINRQRQIAYVVCQAVNYIKKKRISTLKDFAKLDDLAVYNTEARGALHTQLVKMKNYLCSEYFVASNKSADSVSCIMHQDLTHLSLDDERVDFVISSEVFEHIAEPYKAHEEIHRILKTGGRHIFTVPFYQTEFLDEDRVTGDSSGNAVFLKEPLHHVDPLRIEGALVYKIFSLEMLVKLRKIGFRTNLWHLYKPEFGILGPNAIVFEAIKCDT